MLNTVLSELHVINAKQNFLILAMCDGRQMTYQKQSKFSNREVGKYVVCLYRRFTLQAHRTDLITRLVNKLYT
jgi:hypothetical protein